MNLSFRKKKKLSPNQPQEHPLFIHDVGYWQLAFGVVFLHKTALAITASSGTLVCSKTSIVSIN